jgi:hypothetical protein
VLCGGATGSGPYRKWRDRKWPEVTLTRSDRVRMRNRYILYYYYSSSKTCSTVVQIPWLPKVIEGHVISKGWNGVRMRNRKLWAFWPEVTIWNVTRSDRRLRDPFLVLLGVRIDYLEYIANISENTVGKNHYWNILYYMKIKWREKGRKPGLENDRRGRPREHHMGTSSRACALPYFPGESLLVVTLFPVKYPH